MAKYELRSPKTLIDTSETPSKSANGLLSPTSPSDNPTSDNEGSATSKSVSSLLSNSLPVSDVSNYAGQENEKAEVMVC